LEENVMVKLIEAINITLFDFYTSSRVLLFLSLSVQVHSLRTGSLTGDLELTHIPTRNPAWTLTFSPHQLEPVVQQ
jgi:hypothetical protein